MLQNHVDHDLEFRAPCGDQVQQHYSLHGSEGMIADSYKRALRKIVENVAAPDLEPDVEVTQHSFGNCARVAAAVAIVAGVKPVDFVERKELHQAARQPVVALQRLYDVLHLFHVEHIGLRCDVEIIHFCPVYSKRKVTKKIENGSNGSSGSYGNIGGARNVNLV